MKNKLEFKIVTDWRPTGGESSPLWSQLWVRLLIKRGHHKIRSLPKMLTKGDATNIARKMPKPIEEDNDGK